jgi:hypothetical protein
MSAGASRTVGQTVALTLTPVDTLADDTGRFKLFLNAPANAAPAGLQWTFKVPPGLDIVGIEAGKAVHDAGKTLVCNGAKCIVYGMNRTTISNGPIAILKIKADQSLAGGNGSGLPKYEANGRARLRKPEIQLGDPVAVSLDGKAIPVVSDTGLVSPKTP